jgi:hypothetical protein
MISVESIDNNSFSVSVSKDSATEHIVLLNDRFHQDVTNNKLTKTVFIKKRIKSIYIKKI